MIGVDEENVDIVVSKIEDICKKRKHMVTSPSPITESIGVYIPYPIEVEVGGATIFVVDVDNFIRV